MKSQSKWKSQSGAKYEVKVQFLCKTFFVLAILLVMASCGQAQASKPAPGPAAAANPAANYNGGMVSPPLPKPKFTLTDTSGAPFDFAAKTQGYVTLLFFGYTHCPDMCPIQMYLIAQALRKVPAEDVPQIKVVFVTTDPDRDTAKSMRKWLDHFDKSFIGLTGSQSAIDAAQIAANLTPAKKTAIRADGAYEVGHAAFVLAYSKDNLAHLIYPVGIKTEDLAHDLPQLVNEKWNTH